MFVAGVALFRAQNPVAFPSYVALAGVALIVAVIAQRIIKGFSRQLDARALRHRKRRIS